MQDQERFKKNKIMKKRQTSKNDFQTVLSELILNQYDKINENDEDLTDTALIDIAERATERLDEIICDAIYEYLEEDGDEKS